ncbi:MAG: hypothetical protein K2J90_01440 [Lachnospiraceae bacterium]|nr:hypothetical protein [Lachnospiraceae bacterium]
MGKKKIWTAVMTVVLICLFVTGCGKKEETTPVVDWKELHTEVVVKDGVPEPEKTVQQLKVSEDGRYTFHLNCKTGKEGLLTGCVLYDEKGESLFCCMGEEMEAVSEGIELRTGTYTVEFRYLTNQIDWVDFLRGREEIVGVDSYEFQENGRWNIDLEYGLEAGGTRSVYYYLGMIFGVIFTFLLLAFLKWLVGKMGGRVERCGRKDSYDERQQLARGKAYKYAFFTLIFYMTVVSLISEFNRISWFMSFCGIWIGVCLSIMVFAVICILEDAYMSLYENAKGIIMIFSIVAIMNLAVIVRVIVERRPILENGAISLDYMNLVVGVMICVILAVFCGKVIYNKRHLDEEEEE